ncbi:MAG: CHAD domain-containing protein [Acidobacteria bacterium]|nr:CHAD domain-containing protein [Acidobacteriota bacterium]
MKTKRPLYPESATLGSRARETLPGLLDSFTAAIAPACADEKCAETLHAARITGKRLRYAMELYAPACGPAFERHLDALKDILDTMGRIHDLDVNLPLLRRHVQRIRCYNALTRERPLKIPPAGLLDLVTRLEGERHDRFLSLCRSLAPWQRARFRRVFMTSLTQGDPHAPLSAAPRDSRATPDGRIPRRRPPADRSGDRQNE